MKLNTRILSSAAACFLAFSGITSAQAAGFYLQEQSVSGLGSAFAGEAAVARDASTIFFNPAGMTQLDGSQLQIGTYILAPTAELNNRGSQALTGIDLPAPPGTGQPTAALATSGANGDDPIDVTALPNIFYARPVALSSLENDLWLGLGVTAPFGLGSDYGADFFGRYDSTKTELLTVNISPTLAYQVNDWLSVGGGIDIQYVNVNLENAVFNPAIGLGVATPQADGFQALRGTNWATGFNVGLLLQPTDKTNIGLTYRSEVNHHIKGSSTRSGIGAVLQAQGISNGRFSATSDLDLPDIASLSIAHDLNDKWTLLGGITWFGWSNFETIRSVFDDGLQPVAETEQNYENTFAYSIGFDYQYSDKLTLRAGYQFDETPTQDGFRTTRTPDGDRNWFATGMTYKINDKYTLDGALTYITIEDEEISLSRQGGLVSVEAETDNGAVAIASVALTYKF